MTEVDRKVLLRALRALRVGAQNASRGVAAAAAAAPPSTVATSAEASAIGWMLNGTESSYNDTNGTKEIGVGFPMENRYWVLIMFLVPLFTIFGNILVVLAVYRERGLQSVTNYFIVSLAFADILVAAIVMPVSVYVEVRNGYWDFSDTLCDLWIMCDALFSTASILNLVAISIDRFIAVTQPIKYAKHKNSKRTHVTIAGSWLLSIAIALPIGCGLQNLQGVRYQEQFRNVCTFFNGDFLIYSSLGSFYIPCIVMLVLYYRIFTVIRARAQKAAASRRGKVYENAKASAGHNRNANQTEANNDEAAVAASAAEVAAAAAAAADGANDGETAMVLSNKKQQQKRKKKRKKKVLKNSGGGGGGGGGGPPALLLVRANPSRPTRLSVSAVSSRDCLACRTEGIYTGEAPIPHSCDLRLAEHIRLDNDLGYENDCDDDEEDDEEEEEAADCKNAKWSAPMNESQTLAGPSTSNHSGCAGGGAAAGAPTLVATAAAAVETLENVDAAEGGGSERPRQRLFQQLKLKKKKKSKKKTDRSAARREKKATKTLAIVLGVFLLCWLPFFITNLIWAACLKSMSDKSSAGLELAPICGYDRRINVFIVWLGYVNSFMNPLIYTIFNTEFRKAFKKILHID